MSSPANQHLQDSILFLAASDTSFLRLARSVLVPAFFTSRVAEEMWTLCTAFFDRFSEAPGSHFQDEFARLVEDWREDDSDYAVRYITKLKEMHPPNRDYVLRRLDAAAGLRAREDAALKFAELVAAGNIEEADNVMHKALKSGLPENEKQLDYFTDTTSLTTRGERPEYLLHTGVEAMDRLFGGFNRGQLLSILGGAGGGKTWALQYLIARSALRNGLHVLHISHEVTQDLTELRYDMMFTARGTHKGKYLEVPDVRNGKVGYKGLTVRSVYDSAAVSRARRAAASHGGKLVIKKYPMGQCKTSEIERYLNHLSDYDGFEPDVVINDYVDIMDLSEYSKDERHKINAGYMWSKGLADERNILVATASQLNRDGLDRRQIRRKHVAEDIRKLANVDVMLAIGRSPEDMKAGLAGLSVLKARGEPTDGYCTFAPCFDIGQFCLSSWLPGEVDEKALFNMSKDEEDDDRGSKPGATYTEPERFD